MMGSLPGSSARRLSGLTRRGARLGVMLAATLPGLASAQDVGFSPPVPLSWAAGAYEVGLTRGAPGEMIVSSEKVRSDADNGGGQPLVAIFEPGQLNAAPQALDGRSWLEPSVAANRAGQAVIAWTDTLHDLSVRMATRAPGGAFGPTIDVPYGGGYTPSQTRTAINSRGDAVIVFGSYVAGQPLRLFAIFRSASGDFSAPYRVSAPVNTSSPPYVDVKLDDTGHAVVAWSWGWRESPDRVVAAVGTAQGGFEEPQVLAGSQAYPGPVTVAMDGTGGVVLGWEDGEGSMRGVPSRIIVSFAAPGSGQFTLPRQIGEGHDFTPTTLRMAAADDGHVLATWISGVSGSEWSVRVAGGDITRQTFSPSKGVTGLYGPELGVAPDGTALVARQTMYYRTVLSGGTADGALGPDYASGCPVPPGDVTRVGVGGPGDASVVVTHHIVDGTGGPDGIEHVLLRSNPLVAPAPASCAFPGDQPPTSSGPPAGGTDEEVVAGVHVQVPRTISSQQLRGLPVDVTSSTPGRLQVGGSLLSARGRPVALSTVRRETHRPGNVRVHVRPSRRARGTPRVVVLRVAFRDPRHRMHRVERRVRVVAARR